NLEEVDVVGVRGDADLLHAFLHAAHQARQLVAGKVEAAGALEIVEELDEIVLSRLLRELALLFFRAHLGLPPVNSNNAAAMPSSGRIRSATPVRIAALGMPAYSALTSSCTITVPPRRLTARTPSAPSSPLPESTTAMAPAPPLSASEAKSTPADRRVNRTRSLPASASPPPGPTS